MNNITKGGKINVLLPKELFEVLPRRVYHNIILALLSIRNLECTNLPTNSHSNQWAVQIFVAGGFNLLLESGVIAGNKNGTHWN